MLTELLFTRSRLWRKICVFLFVLSLCSPATQAQQSTGNANDKSAFTVKLMNIEAAANETFRYNATLHNGAKKTVVYELKANLPIGWLVTYRVEGSQVTSLNLDAGKTQDISIEINATATAKPDKYKVPINAISNVDTLTLNLEAVVKGSYSLEISTPTGRLSDEVTSGSHKNLHLIVKNSGTLPLNDLQLSGELPSGWESSFEPSTIKQLAPGKTVEVTANLKVPDKTIAGDYATTLSAKNVNTSAQAAFRMIVKTSLLSGWIGIAVILAAVGLVYYLIRKYGRR